MDPPPVGRERSGPTVAGMTDTTGRRAFLKIATGATALAVLPTVLAGTASAAYDISWRFCAKCYGLFYQGHPDNGRCAAGGAHAAAGYYFVLQYDMPVNDHAQDQWRYCPKCYGLFYRGYPNDGACPAGGGHDPAGYNYVLTHDVAPDNLNQNNWRFCTRCFGQFFDGYPGKGVCPGGGGHTAAGYNFVLNHN